MNIVCVICRELLLPSDDIYFTPCGHVFHFPCLTQWLERSKSCPQCREKVTQQRIQRVYFNYSSNDSVVEDPSTLQTRVESLEFKLMLKEKDINHYKTKAETADKQVHGLRRETMRLENEIASKNSVNYALNEQVRLLHESNKIIEQQKKEIDTLRKRIELSNNVKTLLNSSYESVDDMIKTSSDPQTCITYIKVLKQELGASSNKRKEQRTMIKNLHQDLCSLRNERNLMSEELVRRRNLEEELATSESKRLELERKLKALENKETASKDNSESVSEEVARVEKEKPPKEDLIRPHEGPDEAPAAKKSKIAKKPLNILGSPIVISEDSSDEAVIVNLTRESKENETSPYLRVKNRGVTGITQRSLVGTNNSIFGKRRLNINASTAQRGHGSASFDGFGGHSRPEIFPICAKQKKTTSQDAVRAKKAKVDDSNRKLGDFLSILS